MPDNPAYDFYKPDRRDEAWFKRLEEARFVEPPTVSPRPDSAYATKMGTADQLFGDDFEHRFIWKTEGSYYDAFYHILATAERQELMAGWSCCMRLNDRYHDVMVGCRAVEDAVRLKLTL